MQHQREGDLARAEPMYREVLAAEPGNIVSSHLLGSILLQTNRNEAAVALLEDAVARQPQQAILFANLGEAHRRCGRATQAGQSLRRAIALKPDLAEAHYTLGLTLLAESAAEDAIGCFERTVALKPSLAVAYAKLSCALVAAGRIDEAATVCERGLAVDANFADAHNQLGIARAEQGRIDDAIACFRRTLELRPDHTLASGNLVACLRLQAGDTADSDARELRHLEEQALARTSAHRRPFANDRDPDRRLRVGLLSPALRNDACFLVPLLEHRDGAPIEVFWYSLGKAPEDLTRRIRESVDHYRDISRTSDEEALNAIRRDRVDVLVERPTRLGQDRTTLFARKGAPVHVAWGPEPGAPTLDAMALDLVCYDPLTRQPEVGPLPAARTGRVTFGCLSAFAQTNHPVFAVWAQVLAAVPGSRMILRAPSGESRARASEAFSRAGVDGGRIEFVPDRSRAEDFATYQRIDIVLDTFPARGHATSLDAFWMGVPVVTLVAPIAPGHARRAYGDALALGDLAAGTPEQYVSIAAALARDTSRLERLRAELRDRLHRSPLMDGPRSAQAFVEALRTRWRQWCETGPLDSALELCEHAAHSIRDGRLDEGAELLARALEVDPLCAVAYCNLGAIQEKRGQWDAAIASFRRAVEAQPEMVLARQNLGNALVRTGCTAEAVASYKRGAELCPESVELRSAIVYYTQFLPDHSAARVLEEAREWNRRHAQPLTRAIARHTNDRSPERRLRVGYVSPDFRKHVAALFMFPLFSHHDHGQFETFGYSDVAEPDDWTERLVPYFDHWRSIVGLGDESVASQIRADRIDVLVDLTMHMAKNRLLVFARKPAPVQVSWLAYPGTTGLDAIDYRVTDAILDPPENEAHERAIYSERSLRLPETFWCYDPVTKSESTVSPLRLRTRGHVRFGCLNGFYKVNSEVVALWARVLRAVPGSRLVLLVPQGSARERASAAFAQDGIVADRIEFVDFQPRMAYLATYRTIDICLDTFPVNGHTTSLDALWMGVPVVTLVGDTVLGRAGLCHATALGLRDLVAHRPDDYVTIAANLASDVERLSTLRASLRERMQASCLMDAGRFAKNLEAAYRRAWRRRCKQAG